MKIEDFEIESKNKVFIFVWTFLKKQKLSFFITAIFCSLGTNLSIVGGQYFLKIIIDNLSNGYTDVKNIVFLTSLFVVFNYSDIIADIITIKTYFNLEKNIHIGIRNTMFQYIMKYNIKFLMIILLVLLLLKLMI